MCIKKLFINRKQIEFVPGRKQEKGLQRKHMNADRGKKKGEKYQYKNIYMYHQKPSTLQHAAAVYKEILPGLSNHKSGREGTT